MSKYKVIECNICTSRSKKWRVCYNCNNEWCEQCNNDLISSGTTIQYPPPVRGRIQYNCPYCRNGFIKDSRFITPVAVYKKSCNIM